MSNSSDRCSVERGFFHDFRLCDAELSDGEIPVLAAGNQDIVPHIYKSTPQPQNYLDFSGPLKTWGES